MLLVMFFPLPSARRIYNSENVGGGRKKRYEHTYTHTHSQPMKIHTKCGRRHPNIAKCVAFISAISLDKNRLVRFYAIVRKKHSGNVCSADGRTSQSMLAWCVRMGWASLQYYIKHNYLKITLRQYSRNVMKWFNCCIFFPHFSYNYIIHRINWSL